MFLHNKRMMFTVHVDQPDPRFAKLLLEQFGGPNGELAAALRYFTQAWGDSDIKRRDMLLDIATEELSHLEMVAQTLVQLLKGSASAKIDEVEGSLLGQLLDGQHEQFTELAYNSMQPLLAGAGPRLTDSMGHPWTAAYVDSIGQPTADLRSDIAAEARAKIVYERLIKLTDDAGCKRTLGFLMTREIAHQKMFEAALAAIPDNFPPGNVPGDQGFEHTYFADSINGKAEIKPGFSLVEGASRFHFNLVTPTDISAEPPELPDPHPSTAST
jgi:Mn-containing catalase